MNKRTVLLASPRGFCAGVDRAIEIVETALKVYGTPLYVKHEIVHNKHVVQNFIEKGVIFVEEISAIPNHSTVIFSAHGVSPQVWQEAKERHLNIIDATCPLVTKVHLEAKRYAKEGKHILLIGHKNHVETQGTYGEAPDKITIIETVEDVKRLHFPEDMPLAYLTQTTLSVEDTKEIIDALKEKYPHIEGPKKNDICYATTNRQLAVHEISERADLVLVLGSANSSNSNRLKELASKKGIPAYLIDSAKEIQSEWITDSVQVIGVTAGASAPESLVQEVLDELANRYHATEIKEEITVTEDVSFQMPKNLREAMHAAS
ncbi:MAG: 4-hydroxy-3-methylbut-2-enyl diphosphate reductase [Candidatus Hydrogenedentota bacterium]|nr:MAG: 4-hydroxy-3-methylbut-2-enyl diphosphate reductase [Candidatus Hydrogenedentota bacterium]